MTTRKFSLSVLFLKEGTGWVAQCLQYDIAAQGETLQEAMRSFERVVSTHILLDMKDGIEPLSHLPQAPQWYWERFTAGARLANEDRPIPIPIPRDVAASMPPPFMIEAMANDLRVY